MDSVFHGTRGLLEMLLMRARDAAAVERAAAYVARVCIVYGTQAGDGDWAGRVRDAYRCVTLFRAPESLESRHSKEWRY